jgi:prophage antirepressor-like protein
MFVLDQSDHALLINSYSIQMLLVGAEQAPYFKCIDAAKVLGYIKHAQAVTNHVRPRQIKTLGELLKEGVPILGRPYSLDQNDLSHAT